MEDQPEYCQPHNHEQTEPAPSFGWQKAEQIAFHRSACRNLLNPVRLISHVITTMLFKKYTITHLTWHYIDPLATDTLHPMSRD